MTPQKRRANHIWNKFGITQEHYDRLLTEQGGVSAVCKQTETKRNVMNHEVQLLGVDHNHETGEIRGLLCLYCNAAYGYLREDRDRILGLLAYHDRYAKR